MTGVDLEDIFEGGLHAAIVIAVYVDFLDEPSKQPRREVGVSLEGQVERRRPREDEAVLVVHVPERSWAGLGGPRAPPKR